MLDHIIENKVAFSSLKCPLIIPLCVDDEKFIPSPWYTSFGKLLTQLSAMAGLPLRLLELHSLISMNFLTNLAIWNLTHSQRGNVVLWTGEGVNEAEVHSANRLNSSSIPGPQTSGYVVWNHYLALPRNLINSIVRGCTSVQVGFAYRYRY
jgi:hypothetical protein